jgi:hypothetical protein
MAQALVRFLASLYVERDGIEQELRVAQRIQQASLPEAVPKRLHQ